MMDAWCSMRVRDSLWNPSLRTLRLSDDHPFRSGLNYGLPRMSLFFFNLYRSVTSMPIRILFKKTTDCHGL
jgi:hypothetical protein